MLIDEKTAMDLDVVVNWLISQNGFGHASKLRDYMKIGEDRARALFEILGKEFPDVVTEPSSNYGRAWTMLRTTAYAKDFMKYGGVLNHFKKLQEQQQEEKNHRQSEFLANQATVAGVKAANKSAEEANIIARESNEISRSANKTSKISTVVAVISGLISIIALIQTCHK